MAPIVGTSMARLVGSCRVLTVARLKCAPSSQSPTGLCNHMALRTWAHDCGERLLLVSLKLVTLLLQLYFPLELPH